MAGAYVPQAGPPVVPPVPPPPDRNAPIPTPEEARKEVQEQHFRNWQAQQIANERRNDFNSGHPGVNAGVRAKHDTDFILPDAYTTIGPVPVLHGPEFHGQYSIPMVGSSVPGFVDPRVRSVGLSNFSDLLPSGIEYGQYTGWVDLLVSVTLGRRLTLEQHNFTSFYRPAFKFHTDQL